jgi:4-amino-4-deoxy-L-arabinose transferase-like glycosyltransferase
LEDRAIAEATQILADPAVDPSLLKRPHAHAAAVTIARAKPNAIAMVLIAGAILRLAVWWAFGNQPPRNGDERDYNILATNLVEHGEYSLVPGVATSLRPPLYPLLVAGIYEVFGVENWRAVAAVQSLLGLGIAWIVYQIAKSIYSERAGLVAAAFACFYPSLLGYNFLLLSETLFTFLLCLTLWAIVRGLNRDYLWIWPVAGVLLALAALTRSVLWLFPPILAGYLLVAAPGRFDRQATAAALVCVAFAATIAPWSIRNTRLQKTFVAIDVMGGRNVMMGNYEFTPLYRAWDSISNTGEEAWDFVLRKARPEAAGTTQGQLDKLALGYALEFMSAHPGLTFQRSVVKFVNFWQLERELVSGASKGDFGSIPRAGVLGLAGVVTLSYAAVMFLAIFGAIVCPPSNWKTHAICILLSAFICGVHTLAFGHSRYHIPLMPILFLYASAAIVGWRTIWSARASWKPFAAAAVCALLVASWGWELFFIDPQRYFSVL